LGGRCLIEQNDTNERLIQHKMKKNKNPSPALTKGQLWKTATAYIQIWSIGKRLVDYKMMKEPGMKAVRTQGTTIDTLQTYLNDNAAVLVS
jgi:hypothetical protein